MAKTASASLDLRLRNDLPELRRLALAVEGFFARYDLPSDEGARMVLALDELVTNVMHHGGSAAQPVAEIEVSLDLAGDRVVAAWGSLSETAREASSCLYARTPKKKACSHHSRVSSAHALRTPQTS